jgi:hypothetical protein
MNKKQKLVSIVASAVIFSTLLFHPYSFLPVLGDSKELIGTGYKFIWESRPYAEFDYSRLLIQWLGTALI